MKGLITEIKFAYLMWKTNVRSAAQLRGEFMLQVVGMMINNLSFVLVWFVFFQAIGSLNGWNAYDVIALSGCGSFGFGAVFSFFSGGTWIPRYVETGLLDGYLLSPRNLYMRIIASKFDITAIGDVMFGLILVGAYSYLNGSIAPLLILFALTPAISLTYIAMNMITSCAAFYLPEAHNLARDLFKMFLGPSFYPSALFPPGARLIFTFFIPALIVGGIPVEVMKTHALSLVALIYGVAVVWFLLSIAFFYFSVKRYESGNFVGLRG